jgi:hypothetical protein
MIRALKKYIEHGHSDAWCGQESYLKSLKAKSTQACPTAQEPQYAQTILQFKPFKKNDIYPSTFPFLFGL